MIQLDYKDRRPIYEQIVERFAEMIRIGAALPGEQLPSVRALAVELSINPNTIQRAYAELEQRGIVYCVKGKGNFVADNTAITLDGKRELDEQAGKLVAKARQLGLSEQELTERLHKFWEQSTENKKGEGKECLKQGK